MVTPHRIHHDVHAGNKLLPDPGDAGTIRVDEDLQICEMACSAAAETRTLEGPLKAGIRLTVRLYSTLGGAITMTAAEGFNTTGETTATFTEAGDLLTLISVTTSTAWRWEILEGNVGVVISA